MGLYNVINRAALLTGQPEDISVVLANLDAIAVSLANIENVNVKTAAGIAYSKLALANSVARGDMAPGNKVTLSNFAAGPPGSPSDGDIWIAGGVAAGGVRWAFQYSAGSSSAFKWEFIGGPPVILAYPGGGTPFNNAAFVAGPGGWYWYPAANWPIPRNGDYAVEGNMWSDNTNAGSVDHYLAVGAMTSVPSEIIPSAGSGVMRATTGTSITISARGLLVGLGAGTHSVGCSWQSSANGTSRVWDLQTWILPVRIS